jgi:pimeloyl-ACP methyl ester carboxylesterase
LIWNLVEPELARRHRVVTLDVPGFGASAPAGPGFQLEAVADRIARGLAARGIRRFDLVGHSLGAGVAVTLAGRRIRAVRRLVLVAPAGLSAYPGSAVRALVAGVDGLLAVRRSLSPLSDWAWGRRLLLATAVADAAALPPTQARLLVGASAGARRTPEALATITSADLSLALERLPIPVGLIWGARDRTVPARLARKIVRLRPDCQLEMIERAGHVSMVERPEAFARALEALLGRLPGA